MGNYRFKLSDMMPNVWFHKLRNMGRVRNQRKSPSSKKKKQQTSASATQPSKPKQPHQLYDPRKSYYFSRDQLNPSDEYHNSPTNPKSSENLFPDPPRKSSKQIIKKRTARSSPKLVNSSVSAGCRCRAAVESVCTKSDSPPEFSSSPYGSSPEPHFLEPEFRSDRILADGLVSWSSTCGRKAMSNADDIVIEVVNKSFSAKFEKPDGFDNSLSELQLPPIITKTAKSNDLKKTETKEPTKYGRRSSAKFEESANAHGSLPVKVVKEDRITTKEQRTSPSKRFSVTSPGVRLRINSPRIAGRKSIHTHNRRSFMSTSNSSSRKSFSDSFAVVKSSLDPQRDFRDSMVEMIVEKNIKASKDLEDLLACYLSLNSDEYHDLIIKVFKQIWFDLTDRPK
ncbi:hypothetical protein F2P56_008109 [Juglans regia]|uniref:Transcription repressor n=2 Tax=Juglans regia TaxID=51240 RepID=A0A833Y2Q5_JUGRE|nr:transcription repressor OFP1-like [Juglans regia]KAF5476386.1 hypothetical protein F2P56_008109 [Juglans regia]